jgi:hypothetical protein
MRPRGRPAVSAIRQNMVEILSELGSAYGYEIYRIYIKVYPKVSLRSIYYHLKKGILTEEFEQVGVEKEKGEYSWGETAEKTYYRLGKGAIVRNDRRIKAMRENDKPAAD